VTVMLTTAFDQQMANIKTYKRGVTLNKSDMYKPNVHQNKTH